MGPIKSINNGMPCIFYVVYDEIDLMLVHQVENIPSPKSYIAILFHLKKFNQATSGSKVNNGSLI